MDRGPDRTDRRPPREADTADSDGQAEGVDERSEARPRPQLRWVQLREPRHATEIGPNGRTVASHYHAGYDAWEVLLETYEGELSE